MESPQNPATPERPEGGPDPDNQPPSPPPESDPQQDTDDGETAAPEDPADAEEAPTG